jgi:hypothetical protein
VRSAPFATAVALVVALVALAPEEGASEPSNRLLQGKKIFRGSIERIDAAQAKRMTGVSWRAGCPVALRDLRTLTTHWGSIEGRESARRHVPVPIPLWREGFSDVCPTGAVTTSESSRAHVAAKSLIQKYR